MKSLEITLIFAAIIVVSKESLKRFSLMINFLYFDFILIFGKKYFFLLSKTALFYFDQPSSYTNQDCESLKKVLDERSPSFYKFISCCLCLSNQGCDIANFIVSLVKSEYCGSQKKIYLM